MCARDSLTLLRAPALSGFARINLLLSSDMTRGYGRKRDVGHTEPQDSASRKIEWMVPRPGRESRSFPRGLISFNVYSSVVCSR